MFYVDTSVFVAALTPEPATERVQGWLADQQAGSLHISGWTRVEFAAALRFKQATGQIDGAGRERAAAQFARIESYGLTLWPVSVADYEEAARMAAADALPLRAPDALHFAMAWRRGATLCTLDAGLRRACDRIGHAALTP
ncbi:MAG: type II toxin-antitoxin system VapC family toxin [Alphaproteobacteria bacterium]|nr:type II toxin-antitoxin system VapC family toxin [Alphaproteobacteria bacterium]MBU2116385.1 type II toxin-antitoxin system VapC family toxin [Alphaproteobacteria bacterium]MBU2351062.1 type II toxin-antitoxin system VapC family toxin [Alphaproteobacteria bacterium]MBU2381432.1 type II toxin-antitoxin system VapC family toxin [Alphaproteobacteria bacterium]